MQVLTLDLKNSTTQKPAFYQSSDPSQNMLTLTVSNYTGSAISFNSARSKLRIGFAHLLSASEVNAITIQDSDWHATPVNSSRGSALELSRKDSLQLDVNASFSLSLTVPSVSEQPDSGNLTILYSGITGIDDDETVLRFFVLKPPSGKPALPLDAGWLNGMPSVVYVSPDPNNLLSSSLGLFLSNKSNGPLVDTTDNPNGARFLISFPTIPRPAPHSPMPDPGLNGLTYDDLAKDIWMQAVGDGMNQWSISTAYGASNETLVWELRPLSPDILGANQSVELFIDNIRTVLPPFTTSIHIQYLDIPGYDDGVITLHLQKCNPTPGILYFDTSQADIGLGETAELNWDTFAVRSLELSYSVDGKRVVKSSDNGDIKLQSKGFPISPKITTTYTLTAYIATEKYIQRQLTVTVNQLNVVMVIEPLTLTQGATAMMSWNVSGSDRDTCMLDPGGIKLPLSGVEYPLIVNATTPYSITAYNSKKRPPETVVQTTVTVPKVKINTFTASTDSGVDPGSTVTLSWNTEYASTISLEPAADLDPPVSTHPLQLIDNRVVRPQHSTTYTLTTTGYDGPLQEQATVSVNQVEITSFTSSPNPTQPGETATISWTTNHSTSATLTGQIQVSLPNGSVQVNPQRDTDYTLTCIGPNGPVSKSLTLETKCVKIKRFELKCLEENYYICQNIGARFAVIWTVENATSTELIDLSKNKVVATKSGELTVEVYFIPKTYRLVAKGPVGPTSQELTVQYQIPPVTG
jgi:hypothetical protein